MKDLPTFEEFDQESKTVKLLSVAVAKLIRLSHETQRRLDSIENGGCAWHGLAQDTPPEQNTRNGYPDEGDGLGR